jgi:hypothetical protein
MGLGDHFHCNGIVNYYASLEPVEVLVKQKFYSTIQFLYRDNPNVCVHPVADDNEATRLFNAAPHKLDRIDEGTPGVSFNESFYRKAKIPVEYMGKYARIKRDYESELKFFNELGLKKNEYVFCHETNSTRKCFVNYSVVNKSGLRVVKSDRMDKSVYDYMTIIENAKEVHSVPSAFPPLIDCLCGDIADLYFHSHISMYMIKNWKRAQGTLV